jgi:hypothetical protein
LSRGLYFALSRLHFLCLETSHLCGIMWFMRRWLSIAAFSLVLLALPVWAQRHGGGGGAHFASHGGFAGHSFGGHASGGHASVAFHGGGFGHGSENHFRTGNSFHNHRGFHGNRGFYGRRGYYPYYGYAGYYPYGSYDDPFFYDTENEDQDSYAGASYQAPSYPAPYPENGGLQRDVQTLSGKIDRLQADIEARNRPKEQEPETALVFRDQHVEEVRNYAIAGGTLWVLNDHQAGKKIPLAQLDLQATVKMNDDRGVDFQVPR